MQPVNLFTLASAQARWLSARQAAIAGNIANVNTSGFAPSDVEPFGKVLDGATRVALATTEPGHLTAAGMPATGGEATDAPKLVPTGSKVVLEDEFVKAGEVRREYEMNTAIVKAFHRMLLMSAKG